MNPELTILVVTHNGYEKALKTLRSARDHLGPLRAEWIVVDNGSTDGTPDAIEREWPDIVVIRNENRGFAAGNNLGLKLARGRYVLLLNPDVEFVTGTLSELIALLDERPDVGAASVIQTWPDGALQHSIRRFPAARRQWAEALLPSRLRVSMQESVTEVDAYRSELSVDWLVGAFLIVRHSAIDDVGPLDERFFLYAEETDWCFRIRRAGWDIRHIPAVEIIHHVGGYETPELGAQLVLSKRLFAEKHLSRLGRASLCGALVTHQIVRLLLALNLFADPHHGRSRRRVRQEIYTLGVLLKLRDPPFGPCQGHPLR